MPRPFRFRNVLLMLVLAVLVNLPLLDTSYRGHQLAQNGTDVSATVSNKEQLGGDQDPTYILTVRYDPSPFGSSDAGSGGSTDGVVEWADEVDEQTYDDALEGGTVGARVLASPQAHEIDGKVSSSFAAVIAGVGDAALLGAVALMLLVSRRSRRGVLHALGDVERAPGGASLIRTGATDWIVTGPLVGIEVDAVEIMVQGERVRVLLAGHLNPLGYEQEARVIARGREPDRWPTGWPRTWRD